MKYTVSLAILLLLGGVDATAIKAESNKTLTQRAQEDDAVLAGTGAIDIGMIQTKSDDEDEVDANDANVSIASLHKAKGKK